MLVVPPEAFQRIEEVSRTTLGVTEGLPVVEGAPIVMSFAAVIAPPPEKPPFRITLPALDTIFASVPEVARAAVLAIVMSPTALRSSPAPVVMKPLLAWFRVSAPPDLMMSFPDVLTLLTLTLPLAVSVADT